MGSSLGDGSGDDLDDVTLDDRADEDIIGWVVNQINLLKNFCPSHAQLLFSKSPYGQILKILQRLIIAIILLSKSLEEESCLFNRI